MESNRARHRLSTRLPWRRQSGITVIGLLFLVVVLGGFGLAVVKIVPMYLERMKIRTILDDVQTELRGGGNTIVDIRNALDARFTVDYIEMEADQVEIARQGDGFVIRIDKELRAPYLADLWFLIIVDEEAQISR